MKDVARFGLVIAAFFFGSLFAVGSLVAVLLEGDGFTSASRNGPRAGYVALLAVGLLASIVTPFALAAWVFPNGRTALVGAGCVALILGGLLFVIALR